MIFPIRSIVRGWYEDEYLHKVLVLVRQGRYGYELIVGHAGQEPQTAVSWKPKCHDWWSKDWLAPESEVHEEKEEDVNHDFLMFFRVVQELTAETDHDILETFSLPVDRIALIRDVGELEEGQTERHLDGIVSI